MSSAPVSDRSFVPQFPIDQIIIPPERQRDKAEADSTLIASIEKHGFFHPIVVHDNGTLVAGERRLDAARKLNLTHLPVRIFERLSPLDATLIELQENLARKQLTWQEEARAVGKYHSLRLSAFAGWTQQGTATDIGISSGMVSMYLTVAEGLAEDTEGEVAGAQTLRGAYNLLQARAERALIAAQSRGLLTAAIAENILPVVPANASREERTAALLDAIEVRGIAEKTVEQLNTEEDALRQGKIAEALLAEAKRREAVTDTILNVDFLEWAETYNGRKFDVLHVDFPYGKGYSGARTRRTGKAHIAPRYADDPDIYLGLVEGFLALQDNFAHAAAHCIFWFDMMYYQWTIEQFQAAGWNLIQPYPFIWTKGYQGVASDPKRRPRHCYETALLFARGDRRPARLDKDHFECLIDEKLHMNQKPHVMLRHLLSMYVDEHTDVLDPTCGSGSALVAAQQLGANRILGLELDPANAEVARFLLQRPMADVKAAPTGEKVETDNDPD